MYKFGIEDNLKGELKQTLIAWGIHNHRFEHSPVSVHTAKRLIDLTPLRRKEKSDQQIISQNNLSL